MTEDLSTQIKNSLIELRKGLEESIRKIKQISQKQRNNSLLEIENSLIKNKNRVREIITVLNVFNI